MSAVAGENLKNCKTKWPALKRAIRYPKMLESYQRSASAGSPFFSRNRFTKRRKR